MEQPVLRQHVKLVDTLDRLAVFLSLRLASLHGTAADFAQVVVVEHVSQEAPAPDHKSDFNVVQASSPVGRCLRAVACNPAADAEAIDNIPDSRGDEDEWVDRGHGRLRPREDESTIDVVNGVDAGHGPITPRQRVES